MKKFLNWTLLAVFTASALFTSCKDDDDDGNTSKTVYEFSVKEANKTIEAPAEGGTYTILVTSTKTANAGSSNVAYEIVSYPEWTTAAIEQTALVITVAKNSSTTTRETGTVVLKQKESEEKLEITVSQPGFNNSVSLKADGYNVARCKVLVIEPEINGFDQNPVYTWTVKAPGAQEATEAGTEKNLSFIQLEKGSYEVSLTVTDDSEITQTVTTAVTVTDEETAYSNYISQVLEYKPAVLTNTGDPIPFGKTDTETSALAKVNTKLVGADGTKTTTTSVKLGSLGGYIVFQFDHTVMNVKGLRDFRITSYAAASTYPAPGVIYVAFDKNGNGKPDDDEWYEIAGSEYKSTDTRQVSVVYNRPASFDFKANVSDYLTYTINESEKGSFGSGMMQNAFPTWPYYLQESEAGKTISFSGVRMLASNTAIGSSGWPTSTVWYKYGYASNSAPTDEIGSSIDIDWAVDKDGNTVKLPGIDFVKVQCATMQDLGSFYGPAQCRLNGAIDLHLAGKEISSATE